MRQANGKRKKADLSDCEKISLTLSSRYPSCCAEYRDDQIKNGTILPLLAFRFRLAHRSDRLNNSIPSS